MSYVPKGSRNPGDDPRVQELQRHVKIILNVEEYTNQRLKAIAALRKFFHATENEAAVRSNFEKLQTTLKPLLSDRIGAIRTQSALLFGDLGASLALKAEANKFISWIFQHLHHTGTEKRLYLTALKQFIEAGDPETLKTYAPVMIINTKSCLDEITAADQLAPSLDILKKLSAAFPEAFASHFPELIDFLMGWRLDENLPDVAAEAITDCFTVLRPFWLAQPKFTITLLNSFITDMFQIIDKTKAGAPLTSSLTNQLYCFLSCFVTIIKPIAADLVSSEQAEETNSLVLRFVVVLKTVHEALKDNAWLLSATRSLLDISLVLKDKFVGSYNKVLEFLHLAVSPVPATSFLREILQLQLKLLKAITSKTGRLGFSSAQRLLHSDLLRLRLHGDQACAIYVIEIYCYLLRSTNQIDISELVQTTLATEINLLVKKVNKVPGTEAPTDPVLSQVTSISDAYKLLSIDVKILECLQAPSAVENTLKLLVGLAYPPQQSFVSKNSALELITLQTIATLTETLAKSIAGSAAADAAKPQPTFVAHSTSMLALWAYVLQTTQPMHLKVSFLKALAALAQTSFFTKGFPTDLLSTVLELSHDSEEAIRQAVAVVLKSLVERHATPILSVTQLELVLFTTFGKQLDNSSTARASYLDVLRSVDPAFVPLTSSFWFDLETLNPPASSHPASYWQAELTKHLDEGSEPFSKAAFLRVFEFLGHRTEQDSEWLVSLLHGSKVFAPGRNGLRKGLSPEATANLQRIASVNQQFVEFWAMWECAKYFVTAKLRTPLGAPNESLAAAEKLISKITSQASQLRENAVAYIPSEFDDTSDGQYGFTPATADTIKISNSRQRLCRVVLLFIDTLERHIYNGYEGAVNMAAVTNPAVLSFFRANKKSCVDWFTRVRPRLLQASAASASNYDTIRHGFDRIAFLTKFIVAPNPNPDPKLKRETEQAIAHVALAFARTRDADGLEGLVAWCKTYFGPHRRHKNCVSIQTSWLKPLLAQTKGRLQRAVDEYKAITTGLPAEEEPGYRDNGTMQLIVDQTADCLLKLGEWKQAKQWLEEMETRGLANPHTETVTGFNLTKAFTASMEAFEAGQFSKSHQALDTYLRGTSWSAGPVDWSDSYARLQLSEALLLDTMSIWRMLEDFSTLNKSALLSEMKGKLAAASKLLEAPLAFIDLDGTRVSYPFLVQAHCAHLIEQHVEGKARLPPSGHTHQLPLEPSVHDIGAMQQLMRIKKFVATPTFATQGQTHLPDMDQLARLVKLARKQSNFRLAERLATFMTPSSTDGSATSTLYSSYEHAKLLHAQNKPIDAVQGLWDLSSRFKPAAAGGSLNNSEVSISLRLAKWLHPLKDSNNAFLTSLVEQQKLRGVTSVESLVGKILQDTATMAPTHSYTWFVLADWCYRQGMHTFKIVTSADSTAQQLALLTEEERKKLDTLLANGTQPSAALLESISAQVLTKLVEGASDDQTDNTSKQAEVRQVLAIIISGAPAELLDNLCLWWVSVRQRLLRPYKQAAENYFKFLQLNAADASQASQTSEGTTHSLTITATLRLFRLLIKYGSDMPQEFEAWLTNTPAEPWRDIIPQLFARLGHSDPFVRNEVARLISKIGQRYPHVVIYPAVTSIPRSTQPDEMTVQHHQIMKIKTELSSHSPKLVTEVESLISELSRITLLWEEQFIVVLRELQTDLGPRLRTLRDEVTRIADNATTPAADKQRMISDTYATIMKPTIVKLERFLREISRTPETKHERWFQQSYKKMIEDTVAKVKNPANVEVVEPALISAFKDLVREFARYQKRSSLKLDLISPTLISKTKSSSIPIPGQHQDALSSDAVVTIQSFTSTLDVLPTKTKPKKVIMIGSDGNKYPFLLKGREDLHLDERIMQFLIIVNQLLKRDKQTYARRLRARNYAVIPIGTHSGLIQWVDGTTPMYSIFTEWQKRTALSKPSGLKKSKGEEESSQAEPLPKTQSSVQVLRPIDMFYAKLIPILKSMNIGNVMNRADWPVEALKKVFVELERETPKDLLEREIWCSSPTSRDWWAKTQQFARSNAVMSMIGYVIGLGDRHPDNILLDFSTGEAVHIDYNICFEKGLKLRVPEIVPFRMTQTMQRAMGLTNIEGAFRITSEHVLHLLRRSREILLTLLEAFVYDPLVDWAATKAEIEDKAMELDVTFTLIASRIDDLGQQTLAEDSDNFVKSLAKFVPALDKVCKGSGKLASVLTTKAENVKKLESLRTQLTSMLQEITIAKEKHQKAEKEEQSLLEESRALVPILQKTAVEFQQIQTSGEHALAELQILRPNSPLAGLPITLRAESIPRALGQSQTLELLQLKDTTLQQCREKDMDLYNCLMQREAHLLGLVQALNNYRALVFQFPMQYSQTSMSYAWIQHLRQLLEATSADTINAALTFVDEEKILAHAEAERQKEAQLKAEISTTTKRLNELHTLRLEYDAKSAQGEESMSHFKSELMKLVQTFNSNGTGADDPMASAEGTVYLQMTLLSSLTNLATKMREIIAPASASTLSASGQPQSSVFNTAETATFQGISLVHLLKEGWAVADVDTAANIDISRIEQIQQVLFQIQQFRFNFSRVVLPEILKAVQSGDESLRALLKELSSLRSDIEKQTATAGAAPQAPKSQETDDIWDMPSSNSGAAAASATPQGFFDTAPLSDIHSRYTDLVSFEGKTSPIRILLAAFDKIFQTLELSHRQLLTTADSDDEAAQAHLRSIFLDEKIKTLDSIFSLAQKLSPTETQAMPLSNVVSVTTKAIRAYLQKYLTAYLAPLAEKVIAQFIGARIDTEGSTNEMTQHLDDGGLFSSGPAISTAAQAKDLLSRQMEIVCPNADIRSKFEQNAAEYLKACALHHEMTLLKPKGMSRVGKLEAKLQHQQIELSQFQWFHDGALTKWKSIPPEVNTPHAIRASQLEAMVPLVQALTTLQAATAVSEKNYDALEDQIMRAVQWFAQNNFDRTNTLQYIPQAVTLRRQGCALLNQIVHDMTELAKSILAFEANRSSMPSRHPVVAHLKRFTAISSQLQTTHKENQTLKSSVDGLIKTRSQLASQWESSEKTVERDKSVIRAVVEASAGPAKELAAITPPVAQFLTGYNQLWTEVEPLVLSVVRTTEKLEGAAQIHNLAKKLLANHRRFQGQTKTLTKAAEAAAKPLDQDAVGSYVLGVAEAAKEIYGIAGEAPATLEAPPNVDELLELQARVKSQLSELAQHGRDWLQGGEVGQESSQEDADGELPDEAADSAASKVSAPKVQPPARNITAMAVLRRVRQKLEGLDTFATSPATAAHKLTVPDQVDRVIHEATNPDNLCKLYEGWTAWI